MKITIVTGPWLPVPAIQGGAVNRRWQGVAEQFAARGNEVTIICRSFPGQPSTEMINNVQYVRQGGFPQSSNIRIDLLKDLIYALRTIFLLPKADILVINDFWLPLLTSFRSGIGKTVVNAARYPKEQFFLYKRSSLIVAVSHAVAKAIIQQTPNLETRISIIPNPIHPAFFSSNKEIEYRHQTNERVILYAGRIHPEKGIHVLLEAFSLLIRKHSSIKLKILGPYKENQGGGGEKYLHQLKELATDLPVEFQSPIFDVFKLANAYREADIFCYPSMAEKGESFGLAPLEAMAAGLVTVVSDLDCFKDFITNENTGYIFNRNSKDSAAMLARILSKIISNWDENFELINRSISTARQFSYEEVGNLYLKKFQELTQIN